jgi:hypothetical protein
MAIASLDNYIAAAKQRVTWMKTAQRTTIAAFPFSLFELAGNPGAGTLAGANTANGVVPDDSVAGYPIISAFGASAIGYISKVEFANTVAGWLDLYDRLFLAGAYAFNAAVTLASIPSFSARVPGADFGGLQIWVEQVTAGTGNQAVSVGYTNQAGVAGRSTGAVGIGAAATVGRCWQLPLQAGDSGVQVVNSVTGSVATVGTFNVMVLRPLWSGRVQIANGGDVHELLRTGLPRVYETSALYALLAADGVSSGVPELQVEVANG